MVWMFPLEAMTLRITLLPESEMERGVFARGIDEDSLRKIELRGGGKATIS